jgi:hypothetical protein
MANTASEGRQLWSLSGEVVTGVKEEIFRKGLTVFPNPATDYISFDYYEESGSEIENISIVDMIGKRHEVATSLKGKKVYIGNLAPGIYLITFEIGNERLTKKFIKRNM